MSRHVGLVSQCGVAGFLAIVATLHLMQPGYDWRRQFISELALGRMGALMIVAFLALAVAFGSLALLLRRAHAPGFLCALLVVAACLIGTAAVFPIGDATMLHEPLVFGAFGALIVAMVMLPVYSGSFGLRVLSFACVAVCGVVLLSGSKVFLPGTAQRAAAVPILLWVLVAARSRQLFPEHQRLASLGESA